MTAIALLTAVSALGCGLMAGLFFGFSVLVMRGLARLPAPAGIAAMQQINGAVDHPMFLIVFAGTALACLAVTVLSVIGIGEPGAPWRLAGALIYLVGAMALTVRFHIPRNRALDTLDADAPASAEPWSEYLRTWTPANHVRGVAATVAAIALVISLR